MTDTIVAQASAAGEAAVGVVRLSGPRSIEIAAGFLRGKTAFQSAEPRRAQRWRAVEVPAHGGESFLDDTLAVAYRAPSSFTGEDMVEIFPHGSPFVLERLIASAVKGGARPARPGEFTSRAFHNGKLDLAQAEGVAALIAAKTGLAHRAAVHQLSGGLTKRCEALRREVIGLLALFEAQLDHSDEGIPVFDRAEADAAFAALELELERQRAAERSGRFLGEGLRVAIVGAPNAGKSSLLNALLGRERAIVLDQPGTTRDILEERTELAGLPVVLLDTAGLRRHALDPAERVGMERTREAISRADVVLCVLDASRPADEEEMAALAEIAEKSRGSAARGAIAVLNKTDLGLAPGRRPSGFDAAVEVSAKEGRGLKDLERAIAERALPNGGDETVAAANARHHDALRRAERAIGAARTLAADRGNGEELVAAELREALSALGEIAGETRCDEILAAVFSKFCIGK